MEMFLRLVPGAGELPAALPARTAPRPSEPSSHIHASPPSVLRQPSQVATVGEGGREQRPREVKKAPLAHTVMESKLKLRHPDSKFRALNHQAFKGKPLFKPIRNNATDEVK